MSLSAKARALICIMSVCMTVFSSQPIKAIIFDCDGTLVDSEEVHFLSFQEAVQKLGGELTFEEYLSYVGKSGIAVARLLAEKMGYQSPDELLSLKRGYFRHYHHQLGSPPIKGTIAFLQRLLNEKEKMGIKLAVASAAVKTDILNNLESLGILDAFDIVLSGQDDLGDYQDPEGVNKPKPYIYLHAAKLLGVLPEECIVIEDSMPGVQAGKAAGCFTIAIPNRFTKTHDLSSASMKIDSLSEVSVDRFFQMIHSSSHRPSNETTLQSYESGIQEYISGTPAEVSGKMKTWIDAAIGFLPPTPRILEIGSAFGRDAQYIESQGFTVERTDAALSFVTFLQQMGYSARKFNILADDFANTYDFIFANAVFLHFTPQEFEMALSKIRAHLTDRGILAFSVKKGEGEEWSTAKIGRPRYFCYWSLEKIQSHLKAIGFDFISLAEDDKFLLAIVKKR